MAVIKIRSLLRMLEKTRLLTQVFRTFSITNQGRSNHYDVLGITPKATQGDIKSAYYKLSKIYHPDKSKNDESSAKKFRAISEAYEILGNVNLKKIYDKGLLVGTENTSRMSYEPEPEPTDPTLKFYKSRADRHIVRTMDGTTPIYNFDSWSQHHYGNLFKKSQSDKEFLKKKRKKYDDAVKSNNHEALLFLICAICGMFILLVVYGKEDYDLDMTKSKQNNNSSQAINDTRE